jgi:hypothetical protein
VQRPRSPDIQGRQTLRGARFLSATFCWKFGNSLIMNATNPRIFVPVAWGSDFPECSHPIACCLDVLTFAGWSCLQGEYKLDKMHGRGGEEEAKFFRIVCAVSHALHAATGLSRKYMFACTVHTLRLLCAFQHVSVMTLSLPAQYTSGRRAHGTRESTRRTRKMAEVYRHGPVVLGETPTKHGTITYAHACASPCEKKRLTSCG